jgi:hypothetical protein
VTLPFYFFLEMSLINSRLSSLLPVVPFCLASRAIDFVVIFEIIVFLRPGKAAQSSVAILSFRQRTFQEWQVVVVSIVVVLVDTHLFVSWPMQTS